MSDSWNEQAQWHEEKAAELRARIDRLRSPSSSPPSPTPSTTPTPTSDDRLMTLFQTMMTEMRQMVEASARETREMVTALVLGRETPPISPTVIASTSNAQQPNYDDDSIPLSPGIETVLDREATETLELRRLRKERADLQQRIAEIGNEMTIRQDLEESSVGPWVETSNHSDPASLLLPPT